MPALTASSARSQRSTLQGLEGLDQAIRTRLRLALPPPKLSVSEWADRNRVLSPESSGAG
jgi:phage terminase large subunit GpA-like protein